MNSPKLKSKEEPFKSSKTKSGNLPNSIKLVLLRHGESTWNRENRFTGWIDVPLSKKGKQEAAAAAAALKKKEFSFDIAFSSVLKRAYDTLEIVLRKMRISPRIEKSWRLNERHYGALQGLNKSGTAEKYGEVRVQLWRRSYYIRPPALNKNSAMYPGKDPLYSGLRESEIPLTECLKDTLERVRLYWSKTIIPEIKKGKKVLIVAHGNSIRAIVKMLDNIPDSEISGLNIPTGIPLVYEIDRNMKPLKRYYLGNPEAVRKAVEKIESQGKAK
jgi:2,3-bisphosphoglycerate-dependent phosphoglycerate mutase